MPPEAMFAVMMALEIAAVIVALHQPPGRSIRAYGKIVTINMVLIAVAAPKLISVAGYTTNIGNVPISAVVLCQAIIMMKWGKRAALESVILIFIAMVLFVVIGQAIKWTPGVSDASHIDSVFSTSARLVYASFVAFAISQYLLILTICRTAGLPPVARYMIAAIICHTVDSFLFFSFAFGSLKNPQVAEIMLTGLIVKTVFVVLTCPVIAVVQRDKCHPCTGCAARPR